MQNLYMTGNKLIKVENETVDRASLFALHRLHKEPVVNAVIKQPMPK